METGRQSPRQRSTSLTPGLQLVQVATASGAVAGVGAAQSFFGKTGAPTSPDPGPDATVPEQSG